MFKVYLALIIKGFWPFVIVAGSGYVAWLWKQAEIIEIMGRW